MYYKNCTFFVKCFVGLMQQKKKWKKKLSLYKRNKFITKIIMNLNCFLLFLFFVLYFLLNKTIYSLNFFVCCSQHGFIFGFLISLLHQSVWSAVLFCFFGNLTKFSSIVISIKRVIFLKRLDTKNTIKKSKLMAAIACVYNVGAYGRFWWSVMHCHWSLLDYGKPFATGETQ